MKLLLLAVVLTVASCATAKGAAAELVESPAPVNGDYETARRSLEVVRNFVNIYNSRIFKAVGGNVYSVADSVSNVFNFVISVLDLTGSNGETAETRFMQQQYKDVHSRLDSTQLHLEDVKRLIEWQTTRVIYANYENFIMAAANLLDDFVTAPASSREVLKRQFLTGFQHNPLAPLKLYQAVVETDFVISSNLGAAVIHYTANHRPHVMNFLLAIQRLIMRGAQMEIAYEKIMHGNHAAQVTKSAWDARMLRYILRMKQLEDSVKNVFFNQMELDIDAFIYDKRGLNNHDFSGAMYNFLTSKFDWLNWISVAYTNVSGGDKHWTWCCGCTSRFRTHGNRNVLVGSSDPDSSRFTPARGNAILDAAQRVGSGSNAEAWTRLLWGMRQDCNDVAFVSSICWGGCEVWFTANSDRFAWRKISNGGDIRAILFG